MAHFIAAIGPPSMDGLNGADYELRRGWRMNGEYLISGRIISRAWAKSLPGQS